MGNKFYVYEWYNLENNEVFYVGKGSGNRYKSLRSRNKFFIEYYNNNPTDVRIVKYFDNEDEAYKYEEKLTILYKKNNQCKCNLMHGGYGGYSKIWTKEMKEYWSINNPMKDSKQRERMSKNNPMKNPEIVKKMSESRTKPLIIDGIEYKSPSEAAKAFGVSCNTIYTWCKRGYTTKRKPCRYVNEEQKSYNPNIPGSKPVFIDDIYFLSVATAAHFLGATDSSPLCRALKAGKKYKGHTCRYANQQPSQQKSK